MRVYILVFSSVFYYEHISFITSVTIIKQMEKYSHVRY